MCKKAHFSDHHENIINWPKIDTSSCFLAQIKINKSTYL